MSLGSTVVRGLLAGLLLAGASVPLAAAPASAALPGYVRLAHLSPDIAKVDVSVTSFRGRNYSKKFAGISYGALSQYQRMAPGIYTVAMRSHGASGPRPSVIRGTLNVTEGEAYTVAGVGRKDDFSLRVIRDQFEQPAPGKAAVRVVHASSAAPVVDVRATTGSWRAEGVRFPSTTPYSEIAASTWTFRAVPKAAGVRPGEHTVDMKAGTNYTALILDGGTSGVRLVVRPDAAASASTPVGGVDAGLGGGVAVRGDSTGLPGDVLLAMFALAVATSTLLWTKRRARA